MNSVLSFRIGDIVALRHLTLIFSNFTFTRVAVSSALAPRAIITAIPAAGWPLRFDVAV